MANPKDNVWPDKLRIRDTQLYDDLGGLGQRIYTTAGQGYEKREYIRGDLYKTLLTEISEWKEKYHDLIFEVAKKHPDETRHETAKRYIHERENQPLCEAENTVSGRREHE